MPLKPVGRIRRGKTWVITVGIDEYRHWPKLRNAARETDAIEEVLTSEFGWEPYRSLRNEQATAEAVRSIFAADLQEVSPHDSVLFYFAGHGIGLAGKSGGEFGYLIPEAASYYPIPDQPADPEECVDIWEQIVRPCREKDFRAKAVFLILATCHSGMAFKDTWSDSDALVGKSVQALVAGRPQQQVPDAVRGEELPLFTQALIDGLMGLADTGVLKIITASELIAFVKAEVSYKSRQPSVRFPQDPQGGFLEANARGSEFLFTPVKDRLPTSTLLGLRNAESTVRVGTLDSLATSDDLLEPKVEICATALKDPIPDVRAKAAETMGELHTEAVLEHLSRGLDDESDLDVLLQLVRSVGSIGSEGFVCEATIRKLQTMLESNPEAKLRREAAHSLGRTTFTDRNDPDGNLRELAVSALRSALNDRYSSVELRAARALGQLGEEEGFERLVDALGKGRVTRRRQAAVDLGELGDQRASPYLCDAMQDFDQRLGWMACEALIRVGDENAAPALVGALESPVQRMRTRAARALYSITARLWDDREAVARIYAEASNALLECFVAEESDAAPKMHCARALGWLRVAEATSPLREQLEEADEMSWDFRSEVVWALGVIGGSQSVELVSKFLKDEDRRVRQEVIKALGIIGDAASLGILDEVARGDPDLKVRELAHTAIQVVRSDGCVEDRMQQLSRPTT